MKNAYGEMNNSPAALSKQKVDLVKAFQSAKSVNKRLKAFERMEKLFPESELGSKCMNLATQLLTEGCSPQQVLSFGNRALRIFIDNDTKGIPCFGNTPSKIATATGKSGTLCFHYHNSSLYIAFICNLLASASLKLKRFDESISYLNWGNRNLTKLEAVGEASSCGNYCLLGILLSNYLEMHCLKYSMGKYDEAVIPLRKALEIREILMEEGCVQIGQTNEQLSHTYLVIRNYEEALPSCLRALEIYTKHMGHNSLEVAKTLRNLAAIYYELGEYAKALEHGQLSWNILKNMTPNPPELLDVEGVHGDILIGLGRYEEAIKVLKNVVSHTDTRGTVRGFAFVSMARAFCLMEKFDGARKYLRTSQRIFEKIEEHINVSVGFRDMSRLYEKMNDFENAIFLLRRSLSIPQIPLKVLAEGSANLFSLISISCKEDERIAYMEDVVETLRDKFGADHCEVGHGYRNLGAIYSKASQEELAVKCMVKAKDIMDVALGPHHLDSLKTGHALAETYATFRRFHQAIEVQENVVEGLKGMLPREQIFLDEAVMCLNKMKKMECVEVAEYPQSIDGEDISSNQFKSDVSESER